MPVIVTDSLKNRFIPIISLSDFIGVIFLFLINKHNHSTASMLVLADEDFYNPVSYQRYRVLHTRDLKGLEYHKQIDQLLDIVQRIMDIYRADPLVVCDAQAMRGWLIH